MASGSKAGCSTWGWVTFGVLAVIGLAGEYPLPAAGIAAVSILIWIGWLRNKKADAPKIEAANKEDRIKRLRDEIAFFGDYENQFREEVPSGFVFGPEEHVIAMVEGAVLVESRRGPTQFRAGTTGVSFRVTKRISVRQSGTRGQATPGEESPTVVDQGTFVVTNERGMFVGQKESREFDWTKLLSYQVVELRKNACVLYLPTSGRQKVSGIGADEKSTKDMEQRVAFAVALTTGRRDAFIRNIEDELKALTSQEPPGSTLPPPTN